jgi:HlyD family secretion protein
MIKRGLMGAVALILVVGMVRAFLPKPMSVDFATVGRAGIEVTIHGEGKSRVRENFLVSAPIAGRLLRIEREPGDVVIAGETIVATMEPADPAFLDVRSEAQAQAQIGASEAARELTNAQLRRKQAELEFAKRELGRAQQLAGRETISKRTLDQRELDVKTLEAEVSTARSSLLKAESELMLARAALIRPVKGAEGGEACCVQIVSPVSGRVLRLVLESEGVVQAGQPLLELGDLSDLEMVIDLLSTDAVKVEAGDRAYIDHWGGPYPLSAIVRLVEPSGFTKISALGIEEQRVNVILDVTEDPTRWQNLGDGYRVEAFIVVEAKPDVISAPVSALFREQDRWAVYAVIDGDAILTPVEVGLRNERQVEILSGVAPGDTLVIHPPNSVSDGIAVKARNGE